MTNEITGVKNTSEYGKLIKGIAAEFAAVYDDTMKQIKETRKEIFTVETVNSGSREHFKNVSGVEGLKAMNEWADYEELVSYLGDETTFIYNKFGWVVTVTEEAISDTDYKNELNAMKKLSKASMVTLEKNAYAVLNNAWSAATTQDGFNIYKPANTSRLLSTQHTLADGSVVSNVLSDGAVLSHDSVAKLKTLIMTQKLDNGEYMDTSGEFTLVVNPANYDLAVRLTESDRIQGSNNNDINTLKGIKVHMTPHLTSDTAFFLIDKENASLLQQVRLAPKLKQKIDQDNDNLLNQVKSRFAVWFKDWRGVVGSLWDGQAYTD